MLNTFRNNIRFKYLTSIDCKWQRGSKEDLDFPLGGLNPRFVLSERSISFVLSLVNHQSCRLNKYDPHPGWQAALHSIPIGMWLLSRLEHKDMIQSNLPINKNIHHFDW